MRTTKPTRLKILKSSSRLKIGFLPENDCAPLIVAHELGLFREYGLEVELSCEATCASLQKKLVNGELDAIHAPGALPFLMSLRLTPESCDCISGLVLSLQGNGITVSRDLWEKGVNGGGPLMRNAWHRRREKHLSFGVTCPLSASYSLLCQWLRVEEMPVAAGLRVVTVSAWELFPMLKLGYLDGFCAGEPWTSLAVQAGTGVCVSSSAQLAPLHPEKVLVVRAGFAERRADEHERLIAALLEACRFCEEPENRPWICMLLAQPRYVNAPVECLEPGLCGPFAPEDNRVGALRGLNIFYRDCANEPSVTHAKWITGRLYEFLRWKARPAALGRVFRPDVFRRAQKRVMMARPQGSDFLRLTSDL